METVVVNVKTGEEERRPLTDAERADRDALAAAAEQAQAEEAARLADPATDDRPPTRREIVRALAALTGRTPRQVAQALRDARD